jgi:sortase (surface protein transpeptidase)
MQPPSAGRPESRLTQRPAGRRRARLAAFGALAALAAAAVLAIVGVAPELIPTGAREATPASSPAPPPPRPADHSDLAAAAAAAPSVALPGRLLIPSIALDAAVEAVGVDANGDMATPSRAEDVGWFSGGPRPGDPGDSVIAGHLDWYTGPAVFKDLARLRQGDLLVVVRQDGSRSSFRVDSTATYPYDARVPGLFSPAGGPQLSLITCAGSWDAGKAIYSERLIVHATLAG